MGDDVPYTQLGRAWSNRVNDRAKWELIWFTHSKLREFFISSHLDCTVGVYASNVHRGEEG